MTGSKAKQAFDLNREPAAKRSRYGMHPLGQNLLLARRLIEAGVRLVTVVAFTGVPPGQLIFEITEGLLMQDTDATNSALTELKKLGVRIAIDDFGTGYSSLAYLARFAVDVLKIDRSLVSGQRAFKERNAIVSAVVGTARRAAPLDRPSTSRPSTSR